MNREKSFSEAEKTTRLNIWDIELNLRKSNVPWRILRASAEPAVFLMRKNQNCMAFIWVKWRKRTASSDEQQFTALYGAGGFEKSRTDASYKERKDRQKSIDGETRKGGEVMMTDEQLMTLAEEYQTPMHI